jgi:hypothetical protein
VGASAMACRFASETYQRLSSEVPSMSKAMRASGTRRPLPAQDDARPKSSL